MKLFQLYNCPGLVRGVRPQLMVSYGMHALNMIWIRSPSLKWEFDFPVLLDGQEENVRKLGYPRHCKESRLYYKCALIVVKTVHYANINIGLMKRCL